MSFSKPAPKDAVLAASDLIMRFGGIIAINGMDISMPKGSICGIIGPNGAGKTTMFNVLSGFYDPTEGDVLFEGKSIKKLKPNQCCKLGIARTFQNIRLSTQMTVLENVMVGCHVRRCCSWWMSCLGLPMYYKEEDEIREKALNLVKKVGLQDSVDEKAGSLPYGAQRRLEIARALATEPKLLLLDEPAAGMNPQESLDLMHFIRQIRDEFDLTILLIEHDMKVVMGVCEYIWVMEYGTLIAEGEPQEIQSNPEVIRAYLGDDYVVEKH